ncbi:RD21L protein, partial [Agelaius phoeniceus]|nr:RD21L protein [Agelaius phoeniceus]
MFYVHLLINKRGPLAKIWLAAHWEKKLTKAHIFECNLETTVKKILSPKFAIALRTSGHLLLGVVRIYNRKVKYLLADCNEALTKMKTAFRPGLLDLPEENFEAAYQSITLPEEFHDFEAPLPDVKAIDVAEHFTLNQSRAEEITLTEDYESSILLCDRNFGESNEEAEALRRQSFFEGSVLTSSNSLMADPNSASTSGDKSVLHEDVYCFQDDHFGDEEDAADMIEILLRDEQNVLDKDILDVEEARPLSQDLPENSTASEFAVSAPSHINPLFLFESNCADTIVKDGNQTMSDTILLFQEEGFVLEPVDDTGATQRKKKQRKRKLLVDVEKNLSCQTIYKQLSNSTDLLATLDLAPPTKKTMMWKEWGGVDKLLSHSSQPMIHDQLQKFFEKCFKTDRFKMRANGIRRMSEMKEMRKEQDTTEEPSYLQEPAHSETGRKIRNDSFMLTSQNDRNETNENCGEIIQEIISALLALRMFRYSETRAVSCRLQRLNPKSQAKYLNISLSPCQYKSCQNPSPTEQYLAVELPHWDLVHVAPELSLSTKHTGPILSFVSHSLEQTTTGKDNEEIRWGKRTLRLQKTLQQLKRSGVCSFSFRELCQRNTRKEAAATFYIFLVLKKQQILELRQPKPFADLTATAGPMFDKI